MVSLLLYLMAIASISSITSFGSLATSTQLLAGNASVNWNNNNYQDALISIDIDTQEINLEGKIQGEVNG